MAVPLAFGQSSRTGPEWTTAGMDAQRSRSVPGDPQITLEAMKQPGFSFLWKQTFAGGAKGAQPLSEPVLVNTFIGYRGFKALAVLGANDALFAVDYDLGVPYWEKHFDVHGATPACAAGNAVAPGRLTPLVPPPITGGGLRGGYHSAVSKAGEGVPLKEVSRVPGAGVPGAGVVRTPPPAPASTQTAAPANAPAPNGPGIGGASGPGGVPADAGPITGPVRTGPAPGTGLYKGSQPIFAVSSDGVLHAISQGSAKELQKPVAFVPAGSGLSDLIDVNDTVYAATLPGCGSSPDSVFAIDVSRPDRTAVSWKSTTGRIIGPPAFTSTGTVVVVTPQAVVELGAKTLRLMRTIAGGFLSPPVIFTLAGKDTVAVAAADGRILLYSADGSGDDPAGQSLPVAHFKPTTLTTWADGSGMRWLLAADEAQQSGSIQAYRLVSGSGKPMLQPAWNSKAMYAPGKSIVIHGVVFALATGQDRRSGGVGHGKPAVIYALDAANGQELWNSGTRMSSFVGPSAISFSPGQIYVGTNDGTLYAFGFPEPRQ